MADWPLCNLARVNVLGVDVNDVGKTSTEGMLFIESTIRNVLPDDLDNDKFELVYMESPKKAIARACEQAAKGKGKDTGSN